MEIEFFGANALRIKTKKATIVVDDDLEARGSKSITKEKDVLLVTGQMLKSEVAEKNARLVLESAGEFEVGDISVQGVQTRGHMDEAGNETATVFQCAYGGVTVTILGHVHPDLSEEVRELAGGTDVLIVPVGGNGYTLDSIGAVSAIKTIEPDTVIPTYFETSELKFEVPAAPLEDFVKASGLQGSEEQESYKVSKSISDVGQTELVILTVKKA